MYEIAYCRDLPSIEREVLPELREFFSRLRAVRRKLGESPYLNRLQRRRCRENLYVLERLEREFDSVGYREDYWHLHRRLRRYIYLDSEGLALVLSREEVERVSLFLV